MGGNTVTRNRGMDESAGPTSASPGIKRANVRTS